MKRWVKIIAIVISGVTIVGISLLTTTDRTPLQDTTFYKTTLNRLDSLGGLDFNYEGDTLEVGWSKVNLTPDFTTSLAGYGISEFESVRDSIWIRAFVFDNGLQTIALLAPDLLIFPPTVKNILEAQLKSIGVDAIQYSATHTHHSLGNWHPGLVGRLFAGPYDQTTVDWIAAKCIKAIKVAKSNQLKTKIGYAAIQAEDLVYNRLVDTLGTLDPWLRFIMMEQDSGQSAILTTFSAHATTISRDSNIIHRDYPGKLVDELEQIDGIDFAAFMAGAVGSQGPNGKGIGEEKTDFIAESAATQIQLIANVLQPQYISTLKHVSIDLDLREPHIRINNTLRLRPWVFDALFGEYSASITALKIGPNLLVGTPCDYSGELIAPLDSTARSKDLNLMVNSFNGEYVGYVTNDAWYELDKYETRTMNWFGPQNGEYFNYVISEMIGIVGAISSSTP